MNNAGNKKKTSTNDFSLVLIQSGKYMTNLCSCFDRLRYVQQLRKKVQRKKKRKIKYKYDSMAPEP